MDVFEIPAVALFTAMLVSFGIVMLFVTVGDIFRA